MLVSPGDINFTYLKHYKVAGILKSTLACRCVSVDVHVYMYLLTLSTYIVI